MRLKGRFQKIIFFSVISIFFLIFLLFIGEKIFEVSSPFPKKIQYGVTFSPRYTEYLGLDWRTTFLRILEELNVKNLRLSTNWNEIETKKGNFSFSALDFMLDEAQKRDAKVILVTGVRQPRWPECHVPQWAKKLTVKDRQKAILEFINRVVGKYRDHPAIWAWQVENEPLLRFFGEGCDAPNTSFLKSEVELVRKLTDKPIIVTDSGELGFWVTSMKLSDIFGTTLYRTVYNSVSGYTTYPLLPYFYNIHSSLVRKIFAPDNKKTIIAELQSEPWSPKNDLINMPIEEQIRLFSLEKFKDYLDYAQKTGFDTAYLWGVEWWYFMEKQGHPEYLEFARGLFK